jgi:hypothetical protein
MCIVGDCCVNKASSDVQAPLRGVRDQYSSVPRIFEEAKTCATSSYLFIVPKVFIGYIGGALVRSSPIQ